MLDLMLSRRDLLRAMAVGGAAVAVAACQPAAEPTAAPSQPGATAAPSEPEETKLSGKITWMTQGNFEDPESTSYVHRNALALLEEYKKVRPGVEVELVSAPAEDTWNWIRVQAVAGTLPDVVYAWNQEMYWDTALFMDLQDLLELPNPYSPDKKAWKEDMTVGGDYVGGQIRGPGGAIFVVGMPLLGAFNQIVVYYNLDMMLDAGVDTIDMGDGVVRVEPASYAEWLDQMDKLLTAGYVPFDFGSAGNRTHPVRLYTQNLAEDYLYGTLDHAIDDQDIGQPDGNVSMKEAAWATRKGLFSPASHDAIRECLRLIKEQVQYWPEDFLSPRDEAAGNPWILKNLASEWNHGPWRVLTLRADPEMDFEFGTFALPPITEESSPLGTGTQVRALGGSSGAFLRLDLPWMIPASTAKDEKQLELVLDFLHFMTCEESVAYWNEHSEPKGWDPTVTSFEEAIPDPVYRRQLWGHYVPNPHGKDGKDFIWTQFTDIGFQVCELYYADQIDLDECIRQLEDIWQTNVEAQILDHPEWNADAW
ncbi:MAG: ABC transporter substrate-binding protein [Anaerolineae bacterium]|jgi:ABC-type glycerol-3-phosphate transport system substrate-binding protein